MMPMPTSHAEPTPRGGQMVATDGRSLPLEATSLDAVARGGIARTVLRQRFRNVHGEPLQVRYQVPLPADGAVSGYAFELEGRRIVGEIRSREEARQRYEQALVEGRTAALLEQDRSSLFSQEVGNIPPGAVVVAELIVDQKLAWLPEGRWEWRFPTVAAPRYLGAAGRVADAERVSVDVADGDTGARAELTLRIDEPMPGDARPDSPTHALCIEGGSKSTLVRFAAETGARLDRDVAIAWPAAAELPSVQLSVARPLGFERAYGLLTLVPPAATTPFPEVARDLIVLLDTSGSMHGEPLEQAKRVSLALVDSLAERDSLMLIEFSDRARAWHDEPIRAGEKAKTDAKRWIGALRAGGGTEMMSGILAALAPLRGDAQRQVVIVSDGLIGFEHEVVGAIVRQLPAGSRVHTVGVGSAVNRSLTAAAARAGHGYEAILGIGDDPERAAKRLVARTAAPQVVDLRIEGSAVCACAPERLPDLFAGAPALIALELQPGELVVRGRTAAGPWAQRLVVAAADEGTGDRAIAALFGREVVEDLEMRVAAGQSGLDEQVRAIGLRFGIATRLTSWVAVSETPSVDPGEPMRREIMPQALPHGMSVEGLGLRAACAMPMAMSLGRSAPPAGMAPPAPARALSMPSRPVPPPAAMPARALSASEPDEDPATDRMGPAGGRLVVHGRVALRRDDGLVVELTVPEAMHWEPQALRVRLADGSALAVDLVAAQSTRAGAMQAGQLVRLSFRWRDTSPGSLPQSVAIEGGSATLVVLLA